MCIIQILSLYSFPLQARPLLKGKKYAQLVDPRISNSYEEEQLQWLVQVTEQCLRKNPKERFTMNMVSLGAVEYVNQKVHKTERRKHAS